MYQIKKAVDCAKQLDQSSMMPLIELELTYENCKMPGDGGLLLSLPPSAMVRVVKLSDNNNIRARWFFMPKSAPEQDLEAFQSELMRVGIEGDRSPCVIDVDQEGGR